MINVALLLSLDPGLALPESDQWYNLHAYYTPEAFECMLCIFSNSVLNTIDDYYTQY